MRSLKLIFRTSKLIVKLEQLRGRVMSLKGWSRRCFAILLGIVTALALPPLYAWPLLVPGFVGFIWLIEGSPKPKQFPNSKFTISASWLAFSAGWWFGLGFFSAGLYWVSLSFFVDAATYAWMAPIALLFLSAGMALYIGAVGWATYVSSRVGANRVFLLALWWVFFEWVRGWAFTGFPWNLLGTVWTFSEEMIQIVSFTGVLGLSLITVLVASAPAILGIQSIRLAKRFTIVFIAGLTLLMVWVGGDIRLNTATESAVDDVNLKLIQPNISQRDKWKRSLQKHHFKKLLKLSKKSQSDSTKKITHIIWPETATPLYLSSAVDALNLVSVVAPAGGALVTGAPRQNKKRGRDREIWNSIHVIDSSAAIIDTYDKRHLVPFGEYIPFRKFINISKLTGGRVDFSRGVGATVLNVPGAPPAVPLICYEAIFSLKKNLSRDHHRPGWLLNLTNDAWFGLSSGPYQHFAAAQLRSVEAGLPLVRVANTGVSGVIDSYGRVKVKTQLNEEIAIESSLPVALPKLTWFARYQNTTIILIVLTLFWVFRLEYFYTEDQT